MNRPRHAASTIAGATLVFTALLLFSPSARSIEIEGIVFPDQIRVSGEPDQPEQSLRVFGVGLLRYRIVFRGYVAALYLPEGAASDQAFENVPRRIELSYFWSIAGKDFAHAADQILERELSPEKLTSLRSLIDRLHRAYRWSSLRGTS